MGAEASPNLHVPLLAARSRPWAPAPDDYERPRCTPWLTICRYVLAGVFLSSVVLFFIAGIAYFTYTIVTTSAVEYSVAITGIDGLDPTIDLKGDLRPTLSPVFNLTIYIKEFDKFMDAKCIGGHSTELIVSYRDAFLGQGAVLQFCVPMMKEDGVAAKAWGVDVVVPRFLRDRLAGELEQGQAMLDVMVRDPRRYRSQMLVCKAKVGGGRCPCQFEY